MSVNNSLKICGSDFCAQEPQDLILYYLNASFYNHARKKCNEEIRKGKFDVLYLWKAVSMAFQGLKTIERVVYLGSRLLQ